MEKKFYQKTWFKVVAALFVIGLIGQVFQDSNVKDSGTVPLLEPNVDQEAENARIADSLAAKKIDARKRSVEALETSNKFRVDKDDFKPDVAFYTPKDAAKYTNVNWFYTYLSRSGDNFSLRRRFQYESDDWLFVKKVEALLEKDGQKEVLTIFQGRGFERDNSAGRVWEYLDDLVGDVEYLQLIKMNEADNVTLRYSGDQYHNDRKLTNKEKGALRDVLEVYKELR